MFRYADACVRPGQCFLRVPQASVQLALQQSYLWGGHCPLWPGGCTCGSLRVRSMPAFWATRHLLSVCCCFFPHVEIDTRMRSPCSHTSRVSPLEEVSNGGAARQHTGLRGMTTLPHPCRCHSAICAVKGGINRAKPQVCAWGGEHVPLTDV